MSKKEYYQNIINIIKNAQDAIPGSGGPATGGGGAGAGPGVGMPNKHVRDMQTEMKNLAATVTRAGLNKDKSVTQSRDAFNNFITEQYIGTAKTKGVTHTTEPLTPEEQKEHGGDEPTEMHAVLETFKRLSSTTGGLSADGKWNDNTNNGLLNIVAFAEALLRVEADLGYRAQGFDTNQLKALRNAVPTDWYTTEELFKKNPREPEKRANKLVPILQNLTRFYRNFNTGIMKGTGFRGYIEGRQPFETYNNKSDPAQLTIEDQNKLQTGAGISTAKVPVTNITTYDNQKVDSIPLVALTSKEKLFEWAKSIGYTTPQQVAKLLVSIKGSLGAA
jgi:hypothetical protein